jgi:hypothetical protein
MRQLDDNWLTGLYELWFLDIAGLVSSSKRAQARFPDCLDVL